MDSELGRLLDCEDQPIISKDRIPRPHVRGQLLFRRGSDPALQIFDYSGEIPLDHEVREFKSVLSTLDLNFLKDLYKDFGGIPYPPQNVLAVILYGLKQGVRTGEGLAEACRFDVRFRFLMDGLMPSGRTLNRIQARLGDQIPKALNILLKSVRKAKRVSGMVVAVDGTKMGGASSEWKRRQRALPSDPDARTMDSYGNRCLGYNLQIGVDTMGPDRLIVGADVIQDQNDIHAIPTIVEAIHHQLGEHPGYVLADNGFESPESIQYLEERGIESLIAPAEDMPEALCENAHGELVCPAGKPIVFLRTRSEKQRHGVALRDVYRPEGGCAGCPFSRTCSFKSKELKVSHGTDPGARFRNRQRVNSGAASGAMMRRRLVEQPFAALKRHCRFDRFRRRGLHNVRAEFQLWVLSYNIFKVVKALSEQSRLFLLGLLSRNDPFRQILNFLRGKTQHFQIIASL